MGWAAKRETKKKEDQAYCLFGIFDVFMPLIYGEGENALVRLRKKIDKSPRSKFVTYTSFMVRGWLIYLGMRLESGNIH